MRFQPCRILRTPTLMPVAMPTATLYLRVKCYTKTVGEEKRRTKPPWEANRHTKTPWEANCHTKPRQKPSARVHNDRLWKASVSDLLHADAQGIQGGFGKGGAEAEGKGKGHDHKLAWGGVGGGVGGGVKCTHQLLHAQP